MKFRSFFTKIYLWFWVTTVIIMATQITIDRLGHTSPPIGHIERTMKLALSLYGRGTLDMQARGDTYGLTKLDRYLRAEFGVDIHPYDGRLNDIFGRPMPAGTAALVGKSLRSNQYESMITKDMMIMAFSLIGADGQKRTLVSTTPLMPFFPRKNFSSPPGSSFPPLGPQSSLPPTLCTVMTKTEPNSTLPPTLCTAVSMNWEGAQESFRPPFPPRHPMGNRPPFLPFPGGPLQFISRLSIGMLISGLIFYFLARYLTSPITNLREATKRFAAGELGVRVAGRIGRRNDELADLAHDFDHMAEQIESLVTVQRQLLGDISHELRTPLAYINVALELLRKEASPTALELLDRIDHGSATLNTMISELLTIAKLENNVRLSLQNDIDLKQLIQEIAEDSSFEAVGKALKIELLSLVEVTVRGDSDLLRSAIENVIRNAIKYAPYESTIKIQMNRIDQGNNNKVLIQIRDRGPGVPEAELANIFRPFYRVSLARDRQSGGTGLGLAITERAILKHNGTVRAKNAPDGGLNVEIMLPVAF